MSFRFSVVILLAAASSVCHAADSRCTAAPFGDTDVHYIALNLAFEHAAAAQGVPANVLVGMMDATMQAACAAKFNHGDRSMFHKAGISDSAIDTTDTAELARAWFAARNKALSSESESAVPPQAATQSRPGNNYQTVSVRDFVIDGPSLAKRSAKVEIEGTYVLQGSLPTLFSDSQAIMMMRYNPYAGVQPSVPLLTDDGSHQLRAALVACDSNPGSAQTGCQVWIRGSVTVCTLSNGFGASRDAPCVNVEDGGSGSQRRSDPAIVRTAPVGTSAMQTWAMEIQARIQRNWVRPPSAHQGLDCTLYVTQSPKGEVTGVRLGACNGDDAVKQSIQKAVYGASPLPPPPDPSLFQKNLEIYFRPTN
jgi:hypothetical protein